MDLQEQLAQLRKRIARIDRKYSKPVEPPPVTPVDSGCLPDGREVETPMGRHWEMERTWERHRRHGNIGIVDLADLPEDLLDAISAGVAGNCPPVKWGFLDTETTGLAGGSGTYAFLVGVGRITAEGFHLKQFLMRDYGEEASLLHSLTEYLSEFDVLVTYNGKTYDQPLLETRYRIVRARPPFERLSHVDLLYGARRLWKLRFDSCRLMELENQILGVEREGDLPGELIPNVYFEFLRTKETFRLVPIFHHNALDILTLACLTAIVPWAFRSPADAPLHHGAEMIGLGRWLRRAERFEDALVLFRRAINKNISDELLFRTLWDIAELERKLERPDASLAALTDLAASRNPFQSAALEALAKHYEHRAKNYAMALEMTSAALALADTAELRHRRDRLKKKLDAWSKHPKLI
jgi:uncharacterized protein YprB with RNaseH-like and TPR domain